jgi:hypothetical protein
MFRTIVPIVAAAVLVIALADSLVQGSPLVLTGQCCGGFNEQCCGCISVDGNKWVQQPSTNKPPECIDAPSSSFLCDDDVVQCVNVNNVQLFLTKNGTGCSSTCVRPQGNGGLQLFVNSCAQTYGGCD